MQTQFVHNFTCSFAEIRFDIRLLLQGQIIFLHQKANLSSLSFLIWDVKTALTK